MRKFRIIGIISALGLILAIGCAERRNPLILAIATGNYTTMLGAPAGVGTTALTYSVSNNVLHLPDKRTIHAYIPPGYGLDTLQLYPVLYLLPDFNQTSLELGSFYQLKKIADQLIAAGLMDSLIIVVIDADMKNSVTNLGGTFYGNSLLYGQWIDFILNDIIPHIDTFYFATDPSRRAIAGLGMGGYGAYRIALESPGMFEAVGALSAPLSFGGTDVAGWLESFLRPAVMTENGNIYDSIKASIPFDKSKMATSWAVAMSGALSPRDSGEYQGVMFRPVVYQTVDTFGVALPFDGSALVDSIVNKWMANDVEGILDTSLTKQAAFAAMALYFDVGDADELGLESANQSFSNSLNANGISHTFEIYSGYLDHAAGHNDFAYDRLQELFKFVSANM